jgi:hypothetical protein
MPMPAVLIQTVEPRVCIEDRKRARHKGGLNGFLPLIRGAHFGKRLGSGGSVGEALKNFVWQGMET